MRIAPAIHLIAACLLIIPVAGDAGLPDAPIEFRLQRLGYLLSQLDASTPVVQRMMAAWAPYRFSWTQPADAFDRVEEDQPATKIVETAISFLKELPKELRPEASNLLSVAKYQISPSKTIQKWVWIVEFRVDDQSPIAGAGYAQSLFVPVSMKGTVLLDVQKGVW